MSKQPDQLKKVYDKHYKVGADSRNWILVEFYTNDTGRVVENQIAFYPTLQRLLHNAPNTILLSEGLEHTAGALGKIDALLDSAEGSVEAFIQARDILKSARAAAIVAKAEAKMARVRSEEDGE